MRARRHIPVRLLSAPARRSRSRGAAAFAEALKRCWDERRRSPAPRHAPFSAGLGQARRGPATLRPRRCLRDDERRSRAASRWRPVTPLSWPRAGRPGSPKGVVLTHDAVAASAQATSARLGVDPCPGPVARLPAAVACWGPLGRHEGPVDRRHLLRSSPASPPRRQEAAALERGSDAREPRASRPLSPRAGRRGAVSHHRPRRPATPRSTGRQTRSSPTA